MSTMHCSVTWAEANNPARQGIQDFIAENFYEAYHADVNYFCDLLVGCEDHADHFIAAFGITQLKNHPAFLEQYLTCLLYTSPSPRDTERSRMPSSA